MQRPIRHVPMDMNMHSLTIGEAQDLVVYVRAERIQLLFCKHIAARPWSNLTAQILAVKVQVSRTIGKTIQTFVSEGQSYHLQMRKNSIMLTRFVAVVSHWWLFLNLNLVPWWIFQWHLLVWKIIFTLLKILMGSYQTFMEHIIQLHRTLFTHIRSLNLLYRKMSFAKSTKIQEWVQIMWILYCWVFQEDVCKLVITQKWMKQLNLTFIATILSFTL